MSQRSSWVLTFSLVARWSSPKHGSSESFPRINNVSSQSWLNILRLSLYISTFSKSLQMLLSFMDVEERQYFVLVLNFLQEIDLSLDVSRNKLQDVFVDLRIKSFKLHVVLVEHEPWKIQFFHTCCDIKLWYSIADESRMSWSWYRFSTKEPFQESNLDACGQGSNSNFSGSFLFEELTSTIDRVSDRTKEIDGICSHGLSPAGRDVCDEQSILSIDVKGCDQSSPDGGRGPDECKEFPPTILFVLCYVISLINLITSLF